MLAPLHVRFCSSLDEARGQSLCCSTAFFCSSRSSISSRFRKRSLRRVPAPLRTRFSSTPCLYLCVPSFQVLHACTSACPALHYLSRHLCMSGFAVAESAPLQTGFALSESAPLHIRLLGTQGLSLCTRLSVRALAWNTSGGAVIPGRFGDAHQAGRTRVAACAHRVRVHAPQVYLYKRA